ncbi:gluconate transport inducer 1/Pac2, partial [Thamnocephalis sphaerospora]
METYHGYVESVLDALILFEACDLGVLPRVSGRLSEDDRAHIRSGSVYIWDEEEACIQRWTDGRRWSSSRPCGNFIVYDELAANHASGRARASDKSGNAKSRVSSPQASSNQGGKTAPTTPTASTGFGQRRKPILENGLIKRALSMNTANGRRLHLVSYYALNDTDQRLLNIPRNDERLANVRIPDAKYP